MYPYLSQFITTEQIAFLEILLFILGALLVVSGGSLVSSWLRPHKPNIEKLSSYESGEEPVGTAWAPFNARFYGIGLIFILFEVETILLFPWAMVWMNPELNQATNGKWALYMAVVGTILILTLAVGLVYAKTQGHLSWIKRPIIHSPLTTPVPKEHYEKINHYYASSLAPTQSSDQHKPTS
jgi:NADH-quinone oxidoreductase subunit A